MRNISKKYSLGEKFISLSLLFLPLIISIFIISNNYENIIPLSIIAKSFNNDISYISFFKTLIKNSIGSFDNKYLTFSYYLLILLAFITSFDYLKNRKIKSDKSTPINLISVFNNFFKEENIIQNINISFISYAIYLIYFKAYFPWYFSPITYWVAILILLFINRLSHIFSIKKLLIFSILTLFIASNINSIKMRNSYIKEFYIDAQMPYINFIKNKLKKGSKVMTGSSGYSSYFLDEFIINDFTGLDSLEVIKLRKKFPVDFEERALCQNLVDVLVKRENNKRPKRLCKNITEIKLNLSDEIKQEYRNWFLFIRKESFK